VPVPLYHRDRPLYPLLLILNSRYIVYRIAFDVITKHFFSVLLFRNHTPNLLCGKGMVRNMSITPTAGKATFISLVVASW
jgi:hypothetical protein